MFQIHRPAYWRSIGRSLALVAAIAKLSALGACGGSPSAPSGGDLLNFRAGPHYLDLLAYAFSNIPEFPPCVLQDPWPGTFLTFEVDLFRSGDEWLAQTSAPEGSFELRLHAAGGYGPGGYAVAGTMRGAATDTGGPFREPLDVRVTIAAAGGAGSADFDGTANPAVSFASGRLSGAIVFQDSVGATATCSAASWTLQPKGVPRALVALLPTSLPQLSLKSRLRHH